MQFDFLPSVPVPFHEAMLLLDIDHDNDLKR